MVQDLATQWIQAYPCKTKTSQETQRSLQKFLEPERNPKVIYTDNSLEFGKACEDLSWNHCTSTPHRSETNGIAERAVRRVKEGTSAVLLQSGLNESWWADSMECYTYLRNVTDLLSDGKTPYERRFGQPFEGPTIPFGEPFEGPVIPFGGNGRKIVGVVEPTKFKTKLVCILEADESTRMRMGNSIPHYHQDHIAGKGENSLQHYNLVHKFSYASSHENSCSKSSGGQGMGKIGENFGVEPDESQK